ncbi:MAG: hypothetical protein JWP74_75 [Marmoricola sp.]|nr:hypothetical protein [Marmoricola sp.]
MRTELGRRLDELVSDTPSLPSAGLWDRGRRRHRARQAAGAAAVVLALAAIVGGIHTVGPQPHEAQPVQVPKGTGHFPKTVYAPSPWSGGSARYGAPGPLAMFGYADRNRRTGLTGEVQYSSMYGISAITGAVRFLDIPTTNETRRPGAVVVSALSPDGRKVGFERYAGASGGNGGHMVGWGVYDTVTGNVTDLTDPHAARPVPEAGWPIAFSGNSQYLLTEYTPKAVRTSRSHELVAWNVDSGKPMVIEPARFYWDPNPSTSPDGVSWVQGKLVHVDLLNGRRFVLAVDHQVSSASYSPDGRQFAYVDGSHLYAAPANDYGVGNLHEVVTKAKPNEIIGWRDDTHVVVTGPTDTDYRIVDLADGSVQSVRFAGQVPVSLQLASSLWANDLVAGTRPPHAEDPRHERRWTEVAVVAAAALMALLIVAVRRRRRRG